jgi:aminotransferase EvaB
LLPFNNLRLYPVEKNELLQRINKVLDSGIFLSSEETENFECSFAEYIGSRKAFTCGSGTDALYLSLASLMLPIGSEVIMTANCGLYSATVAVRLGLVPLFIDIDYETSQIDLNILEKSISNSTKVLVITHLYGIANEMDKITKICHENGIMLIEDVAQAVGGEFEGKKLGSFGDISAFSFYPTKNLGALGDAGAVLTSNIELGSRIRKLKQYGWSDKYVSDVPLGINSRIDEFQAAILSFRLKSLDVNNDIRQQIIDRYTQILQCSDIEVLGGGLEKRKNVGHLAVIRHKSINAIREKLSKLSIQTFVHYPIPDHLQKSITNRFKVFGDLTNTEKIVNEILSIPCHNNLSEEEVITIEQSLLEVSNEYK